MRHRKKPYTIASATLMVFIAVLGCTGGGDDLAFKNSEWRESVPDSVKFPLAEPVELRIGVQGQNIPVGGTGVQFIERATNVTLKFEQIPRSPGDVELGSIIRNGELYDIIVHGKINLGEESDRRLFVDFREFPSLLPNVKRLADRDANYRNGLASKMTMNDELFTLGSYDPGAVPYVGTLMYRRDLFEKHSLGFDTWVELVASLRTLKELYPESSPLGGTTDDLYYVYPALFGSGMSPHQIVYYDFERADWVFGPYEPEFETFVRIFTELYSEGILSPESIVSVRDETRRLLTSNAVFVTTYAGLTGPIFAYSSLIEDYGAVDDSGAWDRTGKWFESMPIPGTEGKRGRITAGLYTYVRGGWNVYNQSEHVGVAIALLDFLFDPLNALAADLGSEGAVWTYSEEKPVLTEEYAARYAAGGLHSVRSYAREQGIVTGNPLPGLRFTDHFDLFGPPAYKEYRYYLEYDAGRYPANEAIPLDPGMRISKDYDFDYDRARTIVSLETFTKGEIGKFITGRKPLEEYEDFVAQCKKMGADTLLDLYRENSSIFEGALF